MKKKVDELRLKVQVASAAIAVLDSLFANKERESLWGDAYKAWKEHGHTAGIWRKARELTPAGTVVDIGYDFDWLDTPTRVQVIKALGEELQRSVLPQWLKSTGEVWFRGSVVRRIARPLQAKKIVAILDTFEEMGWPRHIDDPITSGRPYSEARRRAIESLNKGLTDIRFFCAGDGERFCWKEQSATRHKKPAAGERLAAKKKPPKKSIL